MIALPSFDLIDKGSLPGYELGVCSESEARGGEVMRTFSRGRRTKSLDASSITQLWIISTHMGYKHEIRLD